MKNLIALAAAVCAAVMPAVAQTSDKPALLIVGTPHFRNPGRDLANIRVGDVTTPERQREIEAIVERLAAFRPTHVAVEWPVDAQDRLDKRYADYRAGRYQLSANETDQIGLRLAAQLGLDKVDASTGSRSRRAGTPIMILRPGPKPTDRARHGRRESSSNRPKRTQRRS